MQNKLLAENRNPFQDYEEAFFYFYKQNAMRTSLERYKHAFRNYHYRHSLFRMSIRPSFYVVSNKISWTRKKGKPFCMNLLFNSEIKTDKSKIFVKSPKRVFKLDLERKKLPICFNSGISKTLILNDCIFENFNFARLDVRLFSLEI